LVSIIGDDGFAAWELAEDGDSVRWCSLLEMFTWVDKFADEADVNDIGGIFFFREVEGTEGDVAENWGCILVGVPKESGG